LSLSSCCRSAITANEQGSLFGSTGKVGYFVVTPIELSDRGDQRILVNRGWVSKERLNPRTRSEGQVEGEVQFVGIVRKNEQREQFTPKNQVGSNRWPIRYGRGNKMRIVTLVIRPLTLQGHCGPFSKARHGPDICGCRCVLDCKRRPSWRPDQGHFEKRPLFLHVDVVSVQLAGRTDG
jgi:hypothetical protein